MKKSLLLILLLWPLLASAVNRSVSVSAPSQVTAGETFLVSSSASTDASDSEQIGFYHAYYSTDGGANWTWFASDVNPGKSASRNAWITAGGAGSTIIVRVKIAFRGGGAGDIDYNGNAINWGGSWSTDQSPPAKIATISVVAPPNRAPTITWVQPNSTSNSDAYINQWTPVQALGGDVDGNLTSTLVWREGVPHAFNGGGNGYQCYSDANGYTRSSPGTVQFSARSGDASGATSNIIYHTINYINRAPTVSASATNQVAGQPITVTWSAADADGNLNRVEIYVTQWGSPHWDSLGVYGAAGSLDWSSSEHFNVNNPAAGAYLFVVRAVDSFSSYTDVYAEFDVTNSVPSGTFKINGTAANATANFGQTVSLVSAVTDANGNLIAHAFWWDQANASTWTHPYLTWAGYAPNMDGWINTSLGSNDYDASGGSSTLSFDFRAVKVGTFSFLTMAQDPQGWVSVGTNPLTVTVNKATPSGTFAARTITTLTSTYRVRVADLDAIFANPYSSAVSAPTGTITYTIVGPGTTVTGGTSGTVLNAGPAYTIRASYPGDTNYNATTADAVWTIAYDANVDSDGDGLPDGLEVQLGTNTGANYTNDVDASTQNLKVHKPN